MRDLEAYACRQSQYGEPTGPTTIFVKHGETLIELESWEAEKLIPMLQKAIKEEGQAMTSQAKTLKKARFPFRLERRVGFWVRVDNKGGVSSATDAERLMWNLLKKHGVI